jgi:epoxide hydrolase-like predicted phosphatase
MAVTAVAFDMGGVLTHSALGGLDRYTTELGLPPGCLSTYFRDDPFMARLEVGEITARDFFKYVCVQAEATHGRPIDMRRLVAAAEEGQVLNHDMLDVVAQVHERCTTALVTNNVAEATWRSTFPFELFDVVLDSSEIGVRKPDPRFYQELLARLRRPAEDIAFVDDFAENLVPAAALGLAVVHFTGLDACCAALMDLGVSLPVRS